jgi:DNA-binding response OmpR family regulator
MSTPILTIHRRELAIGQLAIPLTAAEARIVHALVDHPGRVFTKAELLTIGWRDRHAPARKLDATLVRLNQQLRAAAGATVFENVWGVGYRLSAAVSATP